MTADRSIAPPHAEDIRPAGADATPPAPRQPQGRNPPAARLALALTGGGARAAYQVGCLRFIAREFPDFQPRILTGVSAGAINAAHLASSAKSMREAVQRLEALWLSMQTNKVYRIDARSLVGHLFGWAGRLLSGGSEFAPRMRGMVDTTPLRKFLGSHLPHDAGGVMSQISTNIAQGRLDAVAISTTCYASGRSITWVQGADLERYERRDRSAQRTELTVEHIMASAALPMFFPAVNIDGSWHGDGGVRLTAPLSPALHLGATKILAVSPRYLAPAGPSAADRDSHYPTPARIAGVLMNAVFLDMLDHDELQMRRINDLIRRTPPEQRSDMRNIEVLILRPSRDLGALAGQYEVRLPRLFRFLERGFGTRQSRSADALAMVMFEHEYLKRLIDLGEQDTAARREEIGAFLYEEADASATMSPRPARRLT